MDDFSSDEHPNFFARKEYIFIAPVLVYKPLRKLDTPLQSNRSRELFSTLRVVCIYNYINIKLS